MTKIKFCGLKTLDDIFFVNEILPEYVGFVFAPKSKRYVTPAQVEKFRGTLSEKICAVGVFVNENFQTVAELLNAGIIDAAQLHGDEDDIYIKNLRGMTKKIIIKAFQIKTAEDITAAEKSLADFILADSGAGGGKVFRITNSITHYALRITNCFVLLDAGAGDGKVFDWTLIKNFRQKYFLAGGLTPENVGDAIKLLKPFAVDVSSGIETDGKKDLKKMATFAEVVRRENL